jgi:hypothetical protein
MATNNKEIKICAPSDFTGDRTKLAKFLQEINLFLKINEQVYDTDEKKIIFTLSFMNGGTASAWALMYGSKEPFGTWERFKQEIKETFAPIDDAGQARVEMKTLKQGEDVDQYINEFLLLSQRSGIKEDTALIEYFLDGLKRELVDKIFTMEKLPSTLLETMGAAAKFEGNWKRARAIAGKARETHEKKTPPTPKVERSTLDINRLSQQERTEHMKKGLCFLCHQPGHRSSEHKHGTPPQNFQRPTYQYTLKRRGGEAYANIKAIMAELDEEEKGKTLKLMEEAGF